MAEDLAGIAMFVAVAEAKGFRAAAKRLGVTAPGLSKAVRRLEEQLGVTLLQRTTRSVRLTEAGERYYAAVRPALDQVRAASLEVGEMADQPRGTVRLNVINAADTLLRGPALAGFLRAYPEVRVELIVRDEPTDIVAEGYDAAVRPGDFIDEDMISVPVSGPLRFLVVGAPAYFAIHPVPEHPRDLINHACLNYRAGPDAPPVRWPFTEDGHDFAVAVKDRVLTNDDALLLRLARDGIGLTLGREEAVRPYIERGELVPVLEEFSRRFAGFYLYYPARRQASPALRALIDHLLQLRQAR
jgi:DNA-binding transcriptional LysR family regulator